MSSAIEKVLCSVPRDQENPYLQFNMEVIANYRVVGGTPGRMTCTLFVGSANHQIEPVVTTTDVGDLKSNGARGYVQMMAGVQQSETAPVSVVCALSPKTWFSNLSIAEWGATGPT
jgi:hypothetical protein